MTLGRGDDTIDGLPRSHSMPQMDTLAVAGETHPISPLTPRMAPTIKTSGGQKLFSSFWFGQGQQVKDFNSL